MAMTRFIRYRIEPRKAGLFTQDTKRWAHIIPQCGGDLIGYFSPHPGCGSQAGDETYRQRLREPDPIRANVALPREGRIIAQASRTLVRPRPATGCHPGSAL